MLQFADPLVNAAMLRCADRAAAAGRAQSALLIAESAAASLPGPETSIRLSAIQAACGRSRDARQTLECALKTYSSSLWIQLSLALNDATCGRLAEAADLLQDLVAKHPGERTLRYYLASVLAQVGRFDDANVLFSRGTLVSCGNGTSTSTRTIRFPPRPGNGSVVAPVQREVDLDCSPPADQGIEAVYFVACDAKYFHLFAAAMLKSLIIFGKLHAAVHIHLINPTPEVIADVARLGLGSALPVVWSKETVEIDDLSTSQRRTYYSSSRFLLLPELRRRYNVPIIAADVDQLIVSSLVPVVRDAAPCDIGLIKFTAQAANILALISATFLIINPTEGAVCFLDTVHDVLAERMSDPAGFGWHLDQAALAVAYLFHRELEYQLFAPSILDSRTDIQGTTAKLPEGAILWSITASYPHNLAKLRTSKFQELVPKAGAA